MLTILPLVHLTDTMDGWNEEKLAEVVQQKHGKEKKKNKTAIVSLYIFHCITLCATHHKPIVCSKCSREVTTG